MFRRLFCLFSTVLLIMCSVNSFSVAEEEDYSYDFDLAFSLNADSFPRLFQERAAGYASLINRLGLRGNISWTLSTQSMDLNATLYYTDDPALSYPFRIYGSKTHLYFTSPLIDNEVLFLNMTALMEFSVKAKNTLGVPLSYIALLFPYSTENAVSGLVWAWQDVIGTFTKSSKVPAARFREVSDLWAEEFADNNDLRFWITGIAEGSETPDAVDEEMHSFARYPEKLAGGKPVSVKIAPGSEIWKNASGNIFYSRQESEESSSVNVSLPATDNGYIPEFSSVSRFEDQFLSFDIAASLRRNVPAGISGQTGEDEYAAEDSDEKYDYLEDSDSPDVYLPDLMLDFRANGSGIPRVLPADSVFTLSVSILGALYPNNAFSLLGETKEDGVVTLSLFKSTDGAAAPDEIFRCAGTLVPAAESKYVPDYTLDYPGCYNVFSFTDQSLAEFTDKVLPTLVKSVFSFIVSAPTSACQSFLDDLTDIGVLDMLLD